MSSYNNYDNTSYGADGRDKVVSTGPVSLDRPEANANSGTYYAEGRDQQSYGQGSASYGQQQPTGYQAVQGSTLYAVPVAAATTVATPVQEGYGAEPVRGEHGHHHQQQHHEKSDKPGLGERLKVAFGMTPEQKELKKEHKEEMKAVRQEHKEEKQELKHELTEEQKREAQYHNQQQGGYTSTGNEGYRQEGVQQQGMYVPAQQVNVVELRPAERTNY